jgi:hypothetical protein
VSLFTSLLTLSVCLCLIVEAMGTDLTPSNTSGKEVRTNVFSTYFHDLNFYDVIPLLGTRHYIHANVRFHSSISMVVLFA